MKTFKVKQPALFFFSSMIANLERTLSNAHQNKDQTQTPQTMEGIINNESTTVIIIMLIFFVTVYKKSKWVWSLYTRTILDQPKAPWKEPQNSNSHKTSVRQLKKSNQLSLVCQFDCKTRNATKQCTTKQGQNTETPQSLRYKFNNESTTTELAPYNGQQAKPNRLPR